MVSINPVIENEDEQRLLDFFYSHADTTIHLRYGMMVRDISHERALRLVRLDRYNDLVAIGLAGAPDGERIVAGRGFRAA